MQGSFYVIFGMLNVTLGTTNGITPVIQYKCKMKCDFKYGRKNIMAIVRCDRGHLYNNEESANCPYCDNCKPQNVSKEFPKPVNKPPMSLSDIHEFQGHDDEPRTKIAELIIIDGKYKGKTFEVYDGITSIGSGSADVVLDFEPAISDVCIKVDAPYRIIYNKGHKQFYAVTTPFKIPVKRKGIAGLFFKKTSFVYKPIKGKVLSVLKNKDIIRIGDTKFIFRIICDL